MMCQLGNLRERVLQNFARSDKMCGIIVHVREKSNARE